MDDASLDDVGGAEDNGAAVLLRLVEGNISFQQWSAEHLRDIARAAEEEDQDESSGEDEPIIAKIPELVAEITKNVSTDEHETRDQEASFAPWSSPKQRQAEQRNTRPTARKRRHVDNIDPEVAAFSAELELDRARRRRQLFGRSKAHRRSVLPDHLRKEMGSANIALSRGCLDEVVSRCLKIIKEAPHAADPYETLAVAYQEKGDKEKEFQFSFIAATLKPSDPEQWIDLAEHCLQRNDLKLALHCYSKAVRYGPGDMHSLFQRAWVNQQLGNHKRALEDYTLLLKDPSVTDQSKMAMSLEMAKLFHSQKNADNAISLLETTFHDLPRMVDDNAINLLAELYMMEKKDYRKALQVICELRLGVLAPDRLKLVSCKSKERHKPDVHAGSSTSLSAALQLAAGGLDDEFDDCQGAFSSCSLEEDITEATEWSVPENLPIDLRAKLIVALIHIGEVADAWTMTNVLLQQNAELYGDVYLDVAEALAEKGHHDYAVILLDALVKTKLFNEPAVWLRHAQSLAALQHHGAAVQSYMRVVEMAPNHSEARSILSDLLQFQGQCEAAVRILEPVELQEEDLTFPSQESNENIISDVQQAVYTVMRQDIRLMKQKCELLLQQGKVFEFIDETLLLMKFYLRHVYDKHNIAKFRTIARSRARTLMVEGGLMDAGTTKRAIEESETSKLEMEQENRLSCDEWFQLLFQLCKMLVRTKQFSTLQHVACAGAGSIKLLDKASDYNRRKYNVHLLCATAAYLNGNAELAADHMRPVILKNVGSYAVWNAFGQIGRYLLELRHQKFTVRLLLKSPSSLPLLIINGNHCVQNGRYKFALGLYQRALIQLPRSAFLCLAIGVCFLHLATHRGSSHPCRYTLEGFAFFFRYMKLRGECQEAFFNIGRAFHHLGMLSRAVNFYEKALATRSGLDKWEIGEEKRTRLPVFNKENSRILIDPCDLRREAAFNLSTIYRSSGRTDLARNLLYRYCPV